MKLTAKPPETGFCVTIGEENSKEVWVRLTCAKDLAAKPTKLNNTENVRLLEILRMCVNPGEHASGQCLQPSYLTSLSCSNPSVWQEFLSLPNNILSNGVAHAPLNQ